MLGGTGDSVELKRTWRKGFCNRGVFTKYLLGSLNRETQRMNSMQMFQMVSLSLAKLNVKNKQCKHAYR